MYDKPVFDKLGVLPDLRTAVLGVEDENFRKELAERTGTVWGSLRSDMDLIFLGADSMEALKDLKRLRECLKPDGAIWVVSKKGKDAILKDVDVIAAAKAAGLTDNKVVAFSETHTALRLVIPRAQR